MQLTGYIYQGAVEVITEEGSFQLPMAINLILSPDADEALREVAARAVYQFIARERMEESGSIHPES